MSSYTEELEKKVCDLQAKLDEEREEYKEFYKKAKDTKQEMLYVDENYFNEKLYIETLKKTINNLISQNNHLKDINGNLIRENEMLKEK